MAGVLPRGGNRQMMNEDVSGGKGGGRAGEGWGSAGSRLKAGGGRETMLVAGSSGVRGGCGFREGDSHMRRRALIMLAWAVLGFAGIALIVRACRAGEGTGGAVAGGPTAQSSGSGTADGLVKQNDGEVASGGVFLTGTEQAVVESMTEKGVERGDGPYANDLDHAYQVLLARAYPRCEGSVLARSAVAFLSEEFDRQARRTTSDEEREEWVQRILRTDSFEEVLKDLAARGGEHPDRRQLIDAGLRGMLSGTGWPSACVLSDAQAAELRRMMESRETGEEPGFLGLDVGPWPEVKVASGFPAGRAGLRDGDVVLAINSKDVSHVTTMSEAMELLRGRAGEKVSLTVRRGEQILSFDVRRASRSLALISGRLIEEGIVYVKIPTFEGLGIGDKVKQIIEDCAGKGKCVVVMDVRDNPGGRGEEANAVADIFLDDAYLQMLVFRDGKRIAFKSHPGALEAGVVLLTNKNTGSGAEMLALALRENDHATIIGQPTAGALFGKDMEELEGGELIAFRSEPTVLSPRGEDYSNTGITPDIVISDAGGSGEDAVLEGAIQFARSERAKGASRGSPGP